VSAMSSASVPAPLPRRKRPEATARTDDRAAVATGERMVNAPRLHEIIPTITRR